MTAEDFLESSHKLRVQQQVAREEEEDKADDSEVQEFNNLRQASCWNKTLASWVCHQHVTQSKLRFERLSLGAGRRKNLWNKVEGRLSAFSGVNYKLLNIDPFLSSV